MGVRCDGSDPVVSVATGECWAVCIVEAVGSGHFDTCQYLLRLLGWQFLSTALQFMPNLKFQSFAVPAAFKFHSL